MKTILFALFVLFITAVMQPGVNVSYAQDNCTCAECGYPCKTPMVHASNCKYKNKRQEEKSEDKSINKDLVTEPVDTEYYMLLIQSKVKMISEDATLDNQQKEKQLLEQKEILKTLAPTNETQKMMYEDINVQLQNILNGMQGGLEKSYEVTNGKK